MIKVFEHFDLATVGHYQSVLEAEGIGTYLKNQFTNGALGEIPFVEAVPELWIVDDEDHPRASAILRDLQGDDGDQMPEWECPSCNVVVDGVFTHCWNCESPKPASRGQAE